MLSNDKVDTCFTYWDECLRYDFLRENSKNADNMFETEFEVKLEEILSDNPQECLMKLHNVVLMKYEKNSPKEYNLGLFDYLTLQDESVIVDRKQLKDIRLKYIYIDIHEYIQDVKDCVAYNLQLEGQRGEKKEIISSKGMNKNYSLHTDEFILPFTVIHEVYETELLNEYKYRFYEPSFCKSIYNMMFSDDEILNIFKQSKEYFSNSGYQIAQERKKNNYKLTSYKRLKSFVNAGEISEHTRSDCWLFEKITGFNMAIAAYNGNKNGIVNENTKRLIQVLITCQPNNIRALLTRELFSYLSHQMFTEDLMKELKTIIDKINHRFKILCLIIKKMFCKEFQSKDYTVSTNQESVNMMIYGNTTKLVSTIDELEKDYENLYFSKLEHLIIGETYNYYSKDKEH